MVIPSSGQEIDCIGRLYYRTGAFISAAYRATEVLASLSGGGISVRWELAGVSDKDGGLVSSTEWDTYESFYAKKAPTYRDEQNYCVVAVEQGVREGTRPHRILGSAWECGACTGANVAFVLSGIREDIMLSVFLHELGHLFCAKHVSDDSAVMNTFAGSVKFLEETGGNMRESILAKNKRGACPTVDSYRARRAMAAYPQIARRSSVSGHRDDSHSHHAHTRGCGTCDGYDTTISVVFVVFFSLVIISLIWVTCTGPAV